MARRPSTTNGHATNGHAIGALPIGRPCKLTKAVQAKIIRLLRDGNTRIDACLCSGITRTTFTRWAQQGRLESHGPFRDFWTAIKKAESDAVASCVRVIKKAAIKNWTAAAWWLERRRPESFARRDHIDHTVRGKTSLVVKVIGVGASIEDI